MIHTIAAVVLLQRNTAYNKRGKRQKTVNRRGSAQQIGTPEDTLTLELFVRR